DFDAFVFVDEGDAFFESHATVGGQLNHVVGGLGEIVINGKSGYVVEPKANEIADALSDFFEKSRSTEFVQAVRTEKSKYAWNIMTGKIVELYEQTK
ncbi:MAG: hypothetical protein II935_09585, partial [Bacteroidales bacterium]|nr:hypothetical protein [Bacteroidales bacterium]